jgi:hypothetical protein
MKCILCAEKWNNNIVTSNTDNIVIILHVIVLYRVLFIVQYIGL